MKTKRTVLSIIVFLAVFWISILAGFKYSFKSNADKVASENSLADNLVSPEAAHEVGLSSINGNESANIASIGNRLYQYEEADTDPQTDQDTSNIDDTNDDIPINEIKVASAPSLQEESGALDVADDIADVSEISAENIIPVEDTKAEPSLYTDIGISIAESYVNIRAKATTESEVRGKLYRNSAARILDTVGSWCYIESGSVKGYVNSSYIKTGITDDELIKNYGRLRAQITTEGLNVRKEPDIESDKLTVVYKNEIYPVIDTYDDWIKLDITDDRLIGYVSRDYVELLVDFEKAVSKEEEEELRKLQEEERIKKETEIKYREEVDYTDEELKLLSCLVHAEAGDQSYEGKLAVANVVLNRVKSSKYPNTIRNVIYQPGQFTVASSGSLAKQLDRYDNYTSKSQLLTIKAAKAALSGANNIGNRLYFHSYKSAVKKGYDKKKNAVKIEDHLFW